MPRSCEHSQGLEAVQTGSFDASPAATVTLEQDSPIHNGPPFPVVHVSLQSPYSDYIGLCRHGGGSPESDAGAGPGGGAAGARLVTRRYRCSHRSQREHHSLAPLADAPQAGHIASRGTGTAGAFGHQVAPVLGLRRGRRFPNLATTRKRFNLPSRHIPGSGEVVPRHIEVQLHCTIRKRGTAREAVRAPLVTGYVSSRKRRLGMLWRGNRSPANRDSKTTIERNNLRCRRGRQVRQGRLRSSKIRGVLGVSGHRPASSMPGVRRRDVRVWGR